MKKPEFSNRISNVSPSYLSQQREKYKTIKYGSCIMYPNASRYKNLRTIINDDGNVYHESWFQKTIDYSAEDIYHVVTMVDCNRLDIIANRYYNSPRYWWVIAIANYIIDPFDVPVGTTLRIPPLVSLYNKGGVLGG